MFGKFKQQEEPTNLDTIIDELVREMENISPNTPEFPKLLVYLERLENLRIAKKTKTHTWGGVSPDTLAIVGGNLLGILLIVGYEQKHVVASKGLALLLKTK